MIGKSNFMVPVQDTKNGKESQRLKQPLDLQTLSRMLNIW